MGWTFSENGKAWNAPEIGMLMGNLLAKLAAG